MALYLAKPLLLEKGALFPEAPQNDAGNPLPCGKS
jgi:hypothetical protein